LATHAHHPNPLIVLEAPPMSVETLEFFLLLIGWVVAFLLGRELQSGYHQWRLKAAEQRATTRRD